LKGQNDLNYLQKIGVTVATGFGLGHLPGAPGTFGSLLGLPIAWGLSWAGGLPALIAGTLAVSLIGIWAAGVAERHYGEHDCQKIVIDETAGQMIAVLLVPCTWIHLALGFGFFRLFDSLKPFPAGWVDEHVEGGFGVVLDDIVAGIQAAAATALLVHTGLVEAVVARVVGR
jgi:phosphatidylglycerophosphatase A